MCVGYVDTWKHVALRFDLFFVIDPGLSFFLAAGSVLLHIIFLLGPWRPSRVYAESFGSSL